MNQSLQKLKYVSPANLVLLLRQCAVTVALFQAHTIMLSKGGGIGAAGVAMVAPLLARTCATPYDHALND